MKNLMNISMGSVAGAGIGVAIGYYGFNKRHPSSYGIWYWWCNSFGLYN